MFFSLAYYLWRSRPTVCVTCVWAGVDSAWEQRKLEARKMLENAAESHTSGARFVGRVVVQDTLAVKDLPANLTKFYNELGFLPKPKRDNKPKRLLQKMSFANQSQRQTRTQILENLIKPKENIAN